MLGTRENVEFLLNAALLGKIFVFDITNRCSVECAHCCNRSGRQESDEVMSDGVFEEAVKQISLFGDRKNWVIFIRGGEPMLYPETVKHFVGICRQYTLPSTLLTSGFWGKDKGMIDYVVNEIKPDYLLVSLDYWHQERIPIKYIDNISAVVKGLAKPILAADMTYSKSHPIQEIKTQDNFYRYYQPLNPIGRAENLKDDCELAPNCVPNGEWIETCKRIGLIIEKNGDIHPLCPLEHYSCPVGNMYKEKIEDILNSLGRPKFKVKGEYLFQEVCYLNRQKINCRDKKWADPDYIEELA